MIPGITLSENLKLKRLEAKCEDIVERFIDGDLLKP